MSFDERCNHVFKEKKSSRTRAGRVSSCATWASERSQAVGAARPLSKAPTWARELILDARIEDWDHPRRLRPLDSDRPFLPALSSGDSRGTGRTAQHRAVQSPPAVTVFQNVRIFDGKSAELSPPSNVLVRGNKIERISTQPIPTDRRADTTIIDGGRRTLMPGLIDAHWHVAMASIPRHIAHFGDIGYLNLLASKEARPATLLRGFTTIRDTGGATRSPSNAAPSMKASSRARESFLAARSISQTGGHGDSRPQYEIPEAPLRRSVSRSGSVSR